MAVPAQQSLPWVAILAGGVPLWLPCLAFAMPLACLSIRLPGRWPLRQQVLPSAWRCKTCCGGVVQPVAGRIADRYSALWVLAAGVILYSTGPGLAGDGPNGDYGADRPRLVLWSGSDRGVHDHCFGSGGETGGSPSAFHRFGTGQYQRFCRPSLP